MPNHCENSTTIEGPKEDLEKLLDVIRLHEDTTTDNPSGLKNLVPMPTVLDGTISPAPTSTEPNENWAVWVTEGRWTKEQYDEACAQQVVRYERAQTALAETGYTNWYDWCNRNWGTKWGDYDHYGDDDIQIIGDGSATITINYMTAWGPFSEKFWAEASKKFPTLTFATCYSEPGMCFIGAIVAQDGIIGSEYIEDAFPDLAEDEDGNIADDAWDNYQQEVDDTRSRALDDAYEAFVMEKASLTTR